MSSPDSFETFGIPQVVVAGISRDNPGLSYKQLTVVHPEINYISSGQTNCRLNSQPFTNLPGHAYMYYPGDVFSGQGDATKGTFVCRWVRFSWPEFERLPKTDGRHKTDHQRVTLPRVTQLRSDVQREIQSVFDALLEIHDAGQPGWQLGASGQLLTLISVLMRENDRTGEAPAGGAALDRRLGKACAYMEQNFTRRMKISEIAAAATLTEDYFSRLFTKQMGQSPLQYLIRLRVQEGRRLLVREPGLTIREASRRVGLDDAKYFSHLFRKHFGMTPDEFRKQLTARFGG